MSADGCTPCASAFAPSWRCSDGDIRKLVVLVSVFIDYPFVRFLDLLRGNASSLFEDMAKNSFAGDDERGLSIAVLDTLGEQSPVSSNGVTARDPSLVGR